MNIQQLRTKAGREEIDYLFLKFALQDFAYPRNKINIFLRQGGLIRVKKGLYVFGPEAARDPYHLEALANLIYGPSAISLEYALSFYGLIPERVHTITSITNRRNKHFSTPVGEFSYRYLNSDKYPIGITCVQLDSASTILIATPEKALADLVLLSSPKQRLINQSQLEQYLFEDLRVDVNQLKLFDSKLMAEIAIVYQDSNVNLMAEYIKR